MRTSGDLLKTGTLFSKKLRKYVFVDARVNLEQDSPGAEVRLSAGRSGPRPRLRHFSLGSVCHLLHGQKESLIEETLRR